MGCVLRPFAKSEKFNRAGTSRRCRRSWSVLANSRDRRFTAGIYLALLSARLLGWINVRVARDSPECNRLSARLSDNNERVR
jgi:hypothetical protein